MNKKKILKVLADYFAKKGVMMTPAEYKAADDYDPSIKKWET